ncbi:hypothetical protein GGR55DRAFT_664474 [Xylaria sp. FL0064]|nr:hypothetical protein GGR55DRAFT_664474 [Xylaria sp. FL0064]
MSFPSHAINRRRLNQAQTHPSNHSQRRRLSPFGPRKTLLIISPSQLGGFCYLCVALGFGDKSCKTGMVCTSLGALFCLKQGCTESTCRIPCHLSCRDPRRCLAGVDTKVSQGGIATGDHPSHHPALRDNAHEQTCDRGTSTSITGSLLMLARRQYSIVSPIERGTIRSEQYSSNPRGVYIYEMNPSEST